MFKWPDPAEGRIIVSTPFIIWWTISVAFSVVMFLPWNSWIASWMPLPPLPPPPPPPAAAAAPAAEDGDPPPVVSKLRWRRPIPTSGESLDLEGGKRGGV
jgi:hypothetical protein